MMFSNFKRMKTGLGMGPFHMKAEEDADSINAGKQTIDAGTGFRSAVRRD
jgi:acyl CoA:acetate/3-ketoacid CoA transferase beta subunit